MAVMAHDSREKANDFLQAMGGPRSAGAEAESKADARRRLGKAPAENPTPTQATPPEQV